MFVALAVPGGEEHENAVPRAALTVPALPFEESGRFPGGSSVRETNLLREQLLQLRR